MLEGRNITKYFGGLAALKNVDFKVEEREICGLIGPNGAGKTTLFNCITGIYHPEKGVIKYLDKDITSIKSYQVSKLGIARTFQIVQPFQDMSVIDNVVTAILYGRKRSVNISDAREEAIQYLEFVKLEDKKDIQAKNLTLQEKKKLEFARALSIKPKIILLDEIAAGLNPVETNEITLIIKKVRDEMGVTIFWIEHVMKAIMGVAEKIIVLHHGEKISEGSPKEVTSDSRVINAYLGEKYVL